MNFLIQSVLPLNYIDTDNIFGGMRMNQEIIIRAGEIVAQNTGEVYNLTEDCCGNTWKGIKRTLLL